MAVRKRPARSISRLRAELEKLTTYLDSRATELARYGYVTEINLLDKTRNAADELGERLDKLAEIKEVLE